MAAPMTALECRDLEGLLQPYVDGEFEPGEATDVEEHLAGCANCRAKVDAERAFRHQLRAATAVRAPAALRARIEVGLKREHRLASLRALVRPESVALAALAAAAGFVAFFYNRQLLEPIVDDTVSHHAHNLPLEVQGDQNKVQSWFNGKVDFAVQLPQLRHVSLAGARLSHVRDHNAAYVVYQGPRAHRVSLFVFDDPRAPLELGLAAHRQRIDDRDVLLANERGYNVAMWRDNEIVYSLVSDLEERDIVDLLSGRAQEPAAELRAGSPAPVPSVDVQPASLRQ